MKFNEEATKGNAAFTVLPPGRAVSVIHCGATVLLWLNYWLSSPSSPYWRRCSCRRWQKRGGVAKSIACVNNLKQVGVANVEYIHDYNDYIAPRHYTNRPYAYYHEQIQPYLGTTPIITSLLRCPGIDNHQDFGDYGINFRHVHRRESDGFRRLSQFRRVSSVLSLVDTRQIYNGEFWGNWNVECLVCFPNNINNRPHGRHNGLANTLFLDSHVEGKREGIFTVNEDDIFAHVSNP